MTEGERLDELVDRWEEGGGSAGPAELCRDCPHLLPELERRLEALRSVSWLDEAGGPAPRAGLRGHRLLERLGRGGYGSVWRAVDPQGRAVALKFVEQGEEGASELRVAGRLREFSHPHVVRVHDAWAAGGGLFVSMELAECSLLDRAGGGALPRGELLKHMAGAAAGLDALHAAGLHHRDVKPSNIVLVGGAAKLADFGLAKAATRRASHTGALTVAYAAPEVFSGRTTREADQYALAVSYCELAAGRRPFSGTEARLVAAHLLEPPDLSMLPEGDRPAVARALAKRPEERWPSCSEFVGALGRGSAGRRRLGRRAALAAGAGLAAAVCGAGLAWRRWGGAGVVAGTVTQLYPHGPGARRNVRSVDVARLGAPFNRHAALVTGSLGLVLLDALTGEVLVRLPPEGATSCALSRGPGAVAASGFDSGRIALWDLSSGHALAELRGPIKPVVSLAFSPGGELLVSGSLDGTVRLWDVATRQQLASVIHGGKVAYSPNGGLVASGGWGADVQVCALKGLRPEKGLRPVKGLLSVTAWNHGAPVESLCFLPDGGHVVTGAAIGTVYVWRASDGREVRRLELGAWAFAVAAHGRRVVAGGDNRVRRWDLETGRLLAEAPGLPQPGTVQAVAAFEEGGGEHALLGTDLHGLWLWTVGP